MKFGALRSKISVDRCCDRLSCRPISPKLCPYSLAETIRLRPLGDTSHKGGRGVFGARGITEHEGG